MIGFKLLINQFTLDVSVNFLRFLFCIWSSNQKAYKFRIVEMKDQKDSFRNDTFDSKLLDKKSSFFNKIFIEIVASFFLVENQLNIINVTQIDKDSILICHDNFVKIIGLDGIVKQELNNRCSILEFSFKIESLVCLPDQESVIAFHKHGLEERSFRENDVILILFIF